LPIALDEIYGRIRNIVFSSLSPETPVGMLAEADGTVRQQLVGWKVETTAGQVRVRVEDEDVAGTDGGELCVSLYGKDSGGTKDALRTNADQELIVTQRTPAYAQAATRAVGPDLLTTSEADLVDLTSVFGATDYLEVYVTVVNITSTAATATLGIDAGGGGSLTNGEYFMNAETIPANGSSGLRGPYTMFGNAIIRGLASANNTLVAHWVIKRYGDRV
jgi:hypothetical protein